ncbi:MAG: 1-acyl-sn-glycerol-3-phosphate acyltransferase [Chlamydiales bacterium]|nr:1-acyl-sn-glycerol-3-phosphate acyltransferase [Chlamydiales bacterium]
MMLFPEVLKKELDSEQIPQQVHDLFLEMYSSYKESIENHGMNVRDHQGVFLQYLGFLKDELRNPYTFEPYHKKITAPINYFQFSIDLFYHLVNRGESKIFHKESLAKMRNQLRKGENVIFLANHQTEVDPQMLYLMLENSYPDIGGETIFIAGDRVVSDPAAIPLSRGTNLLCIYSKRHINNPPERKEEKLKHNQRTMKLMRELLAEGGKCIYMAPSGGRDRKNEKGEIEVAPFDPQSIEMFRLQAKQAKTPTHFYPLAMHTYDILPPPEKVKSELGEARRPAYATIHLAFGDEIDMDNFPGCEVQDRHAKREARAHYIWSLVKHYYSEFPS